MTNHPSDLLWWQRGVIYQVYPRSFQDTTGNGVGDLEGVIQRLDYLADLGVDALWLSPIYPSPMADFGYDVADYCNVDPLFGDLATFDRLVAEAHARGIRIILDYVLNHTSDQHPCFVESRSSRDSAKRDWYIWRDPRPGEGDDEGGDDRQRRPPNNWGSFFGGPAWTFDEATGQYYLHQFLPEQPELNWRNPAVKAAMLDVIRFWMERGVDGLRMDVVWLIIKDADLRDNPPNPDADPDLPPNDIHGRQLHVYSGDQEEVHAYIRDIRRVLDEYEAPGKERCGIGEIYLPLARWVRYYGAAADGTGDELHLPYNFRLIPLPWEAAAMRRSVDEMEAALPPFAWPNYVLGNHDQVRLATRYGGQRQPQLVARTAAMMLLTLRGTPTIYYGEELGMEQAQIPPDRIQDPPGVKLGPSYSRDGCRTPMQWRRDVNAGFCSADVEPWLPIPGNFVSRNAAAQSEDPASMLNLYRRLLHDRRQTPALYRGHYRSLDVVEARDTNPKACDDCFVYLREWNGERRLVALNFVDRSLEIDVPGEQTGRITLSSYLDREENVDLDHLTLRPHEGIIVEL
ncbi:MAG TPA: DUF3459 domain-containing protein [Chloroflexi bacterium]|nr:DUF3459 domain-containing protein [Chloroflexota bacterium]